MTVRKILCLAVICLAVGSQTVCAQHLRRVSFAPGVAADVSDSLRHDEPETDSTVTNDDQEANSIATNDEPRLHGTVGLGAGFFTGWGMDGGFTTTGADLSYRVNDRLTLGGGLGIVRGFGEQDIHLHGGHERSFAPRSARANAAIHAEGLYKVNDRLTVAAAVMYMQGNMMPFISPDGRNGYALGASAQVRYRFGSDNYLSLYLQYMRSERMPLYLYPYSWGGYGSHLWYDTPLGFYGW